MADELLDIGGIIITLDTLAIPRAKLTATVLARGVLDYAKLIECRRRNDGKEEVLVVEVEVQTPQVRAYDIRPTERVAFVFAQSDARPDVLSLRPNFPQVPHLNLTLTEYPKSLCLYEQGWSEVKSGWTPARFIERIRYWFAETVKGSLHKEDQPLEPLIVGSGSQLIIPHDLFTAKADELQPLMVSFPDGEKGKILLAKRPTGSVWPEGLPFVAVALTAEPQTHGVIRNAPQNLQDLHQFLSAAGLDLLGKLRASQALWANPRNLKARLIIVVACPKTRGEKSSVESTDVWSFMSLKTVADVLTGIGRRAAGGGLILGEAKEDEQGQAIPLEVLRTVYSLSRCTAAWLNGVREPSELKVVAVGLGALGSKVHLGLVRSGFGRWTLVDEDVLLSHNTARHQYTGFSVGIKKATVAQLESQSLFDGEPPPVAIATDVIEPGENAKVLNAALTEAELILDMSASVTVARQLSLSAESKARRVSVFLNPAGTDLVVLAEDAERQITLDALEFQFYRELLTNPKLEAHLTRKTGRVRYSASCRDITSRVPDDQVSLLAAVAVRAIRSLHENPAAQIKIWQLDSSSMEVAQLSLMASPLEVQPFAGWTLVLDDSLKKKLQGLRQAKLPNETGGVLIGYFDHNHQRVYAVDTIPSPPDSDEWPTLYIRGSDMLHQEVERVRTLTAGNLEYVGEWHSHPAGYGCRPSTDDVKVFAWLTTHMDDEGQPALMAIVGDEGPHFFLGQIIWNEA